MELIIAEIIRSFYNAGFTIFCILFVTPRKKLKWWQTAVFIILTMAGYHIMRQSYMHGGLLLGAVFEYSVVILPVLFICTGDPWRNILIRLIFQVGALTAYYFELAAFSLILQDDFDSYWFDTVGVVSLRDELFNSFFFIYEMLPACLILRYVVKRWSEKHKKIYTWIVLFYMAAGMISGIIKFREWKDGSFNNELIIVIFIIPNVILMFLTNMMYTRSERNRIERLNSWYEERIKDIDGNVSRGNLHDHIQALVEKCESAGISINCLDGFGKTEMTTGLELLTDRLFDLIISSGARAAEVSFMPAGGVKLINVEVIKGDKGSENGDIAVKEKDIESIVRDNGGTMLAGDGKLSIMLIDRI